LSSLGVEQSSVTNHPSGVYAAGGDITKAELPDYFEVDYVRVYALSN
jgi:hypothetical protein